VSFAYVEPASVDEAVGLLAEDGDDAVALAGGTAFTLLLRQGLLRPRRVVGLRRIAAMRGLERRAGGLWIGGLTTHRDVELSSLVRATHPALAAAFEAIATVRIRNQATIAGNLAHADPAQDPPPILIALDAAVEIAGPDGTRRTLPVEDLFEDWFATVLGPADLITAVTVPDPPAGTRAAYRKFLPRSFDDYATVSVAVAVRLDEDGRFASVRIALGSVGATPIRARKVEAALLGEVPDAARLSDAAALVRDEIDPLDDARGSAAYKREMARVWVNRALAEVVS
jgi:carbon-monoxide dehydrogenase medium subunit